MRHATQRTIYALCTLVVGCQSSRPPTPQLAVGGDGSPTAATGLPKSPPSSGTPAALPPTTTRATDAASEPASQEDTGDGSCPTLQVTLDGQAIVLPNVLARGHANGGLEMDLDNRTEVTCPMFLSGVVTMNQGALSLHVIGKMTADAVALPQVAWDNDFEDAAVRLVGKPPARPGDEVSMCVPRTVTLHGQALYGADRAMTVRGLVRGRYCGRMVSL
jgi:hypothetical protein